MTRWARRSAPPGARALAATPWEQLAPSGEPEPPRAAKGRRRKKEYENQDVNGFAAHRGEQRQEEEEARRKDRRRESRRLRRQERKKNAMVCFHCREPGHGVADCPAVLESQDMGTGICYRCGSTEHDLSKCRAKVDPAAGGGCKLCGSVEHFKKDCPEKQNAVLVVLGVLPCWGRPQAVQEAELALALLCCVPAEQVTVGRWTPGLSADHEDVAAAPALQRPQPKRPKVVTF
ncbi:hypothetical protein DUI87_22155 [Hirundo rustica rustica]|uniref:CCHC-type domain-containing protein n=1 Tax=Hirundo rustica rustica TaxID=333673 RepID=A0A3M0K255_HIRRU|nr:hypothetical protein DUI87_22155 [Hirundo rustica rustica]